MVVSRCAVESKVYLNKPKVEEFYNSKKKDTKPDLESTRYIESSGKPWIPNGIA